MKIGEGRRPHDWHVKEAGLWQGAGAWGHSMMNGFGFSVSGIFSRAGSMEPRWWSGRRAWPEIHAEIQACQNRFHVKSGQLSAGTSTLACVLKKRTASMKCSYSSQTRQKRKKKKREIVGGEKEQGRQMAQTEVRKQTQEWQEEARQRASEWGSVNSRSGTVGWAVGGNIGMKKNLTEQTGGTNDYRSAFLPYRQDRWREQSGMVFLLSLTTCFWSSLN